jgi:hypothetical protein
MSRRIVWRGTTGGGGGGEGDGERAFAAFECGIKYAQVQPNSTSSFTASVLTIVRELLLVFTKDHKRSHRRLTEQ